MIQAARILLRHWQDNDAESLYKYASDPDVGPLAGWESHKSIDESLNIIRTVYGNDTTWAIVLDDEPIGCIGYMRTFELNLPVYDGDVLVGYWVAKPYWNQGICTEALRLMLAHMQTMTNIRSLISCHYDDNPASGRVLEKCGFKPTGEASTSETLHEDTDRPIRILRLNI